jgi:foldase protein PrsA
VSPGSKGNPATQGKKKGPSAAERAAERVGRHRVIGLIAFGALLVVCFAAVAVAQGIGHDEPTGEEIVVIEDAPDGTITQEDLDRAITQTAARNGLQDVPPADDPQYEQLRDAALSDLILSRWVLGEADERGIEVSEREVDEELDRVIQQEFGSQKAFEKFLRQSGFTLEEARQRVKLQVISQRIQEAVLPSDPSISDQEIEDYYDANETQFETPETRDVRVVLTKTEAEADEALAALEEDDTPKGWQEVAKEYSIDEATKNSGGLREQVVEGQSEPALDEQIFQAPEGELVGPFRTNAGFYVIQVESINPASTTSIDDARRDIEQTLISAKQSVIADTFQQDFNAKWKARTFCADDYRIDRCANAEPAASSCTEEVAEKSGCGAAVPSQPVIAPGTATQLGGTPATALPQGPVFPAAAAATGLPPGIQTIPGAPPGTAPPGTAPAPGAAPGTPPGG